MKPQALQTPRTIITGLMMVIGVGLFVLIAVKAIRQISDKQYIVGKQHTVSGGFHSNTPVAVLGAVNDYGSNLALQLGTRINSSNDKATDDNTANDPSSPLGKPTTKAGKQVDHSENSDKNMGSSDFEERSNNNAVNAAIDHSTFATHKEVKDR